jgi:uncharacterized protein (DUF433 family)
MSAPDGLIGIGLYTPSEAERLTGIRASKIIRWLHGHDIADQHYEPLWRPQVDLKDGHVYLGFRDLMEVRVANAFISRGLSAQKVRRAIEIAREMIGEERPLSTARFRTDGRTVFLQVLEQDGDERLIDLFRNQFSFREVLEPSLKNLELDDDGVPARWWPIGKTKRILVDPEKSFGQPIEADSGVPAAILASAAKAEGSPEAAALAWRVSVSSIRRAVEFQDAYDARLAA